MGNTAPSSILLDVKYVPPEGAEVELSKPPAICQLPGIQFDSDIRIRCVIEKLGSEVWVTGVVDTKIRLTCSRCVEEFGFPIQADFKSLFTPAEEHKPGEVVEEADDLVEILPFDGQQIDITDVIRDQVVLAIPIQPLCQADCAGLCPRCGINRNQQTCQCGGEEIDPRFEILRKLKR